LLLLLPCLSIASCTMELVGRVRATLFKVSQNLKGESGDGLRDVNATASVHDHRRALVIVKAETGRRSIFRKPAIQFGFENMGFSAARYQQCGNEEHYTSDALRRRKRLRQDPGVVEWLHQFFSLFQKDTAGCASKEEVISVQVRMAKALFSPQDWNEAEAVSLAHFDWKREMGGAECMTRNAFCDSLFEVVDLWTTGISVEEYQVSLRVYCCLYTAASLTELFCCFLDRAFSRHCSSESLVRVLAVVVVGRSSRKSPPCKP
jgi:hypothetical protein